MEVMAVKRFQILNLTMFIPWERMILKVKMIMEGKMKIMSLMNKRLEDMRNFLGWSQM
jgi:hypothetical protein